MRTETIDLSVARESAIITCILAGAQKQSEKMGKLYSGEKRKASGVLSLGLLAWAAVGRLTRHPM